MNVVPKKLIPYEKGFYRLFTTDGKTAVQLGKKQKLRMKQVEWTTFLSFHTKYELFKFLISEDAGDLDHLQFDETKIENG